MSHLDRLYYRVRDILDGEDRNRSGDRESLLVAEEGMISLLATLTVMLLLTVAVLLANVILVVNEKIEVQNAADAAATSAAIQKARGLNAVTNVNHMLGELLGLIVAHNAIAGDDLPRIHENDTAAMNTAHGVLTAAYGLASIAVPQPSPTVYQDVSRDLRCEAAVRAAQKQLRWALSGVYGVMAAGGALQKFPLTAPIGQAMIVAAKVLEFYIGIEMKVLIVLERIARSMVNPVKQIFNTAPKAARVIVLEVEARMTPIIENTAKDAAKLNGTDGAVLKLGLPIMDPLLKLPLTNDPRSKARSKEEMADSQLVRASWPWAVHHRGLLFKLTVWMIFSGFRGHYRDYTEKYMLKKSYEVYRDQGAYLRVLEGWDQPSKKGHESWGKNRSEAERKFAVLAFVKRKALQPTGGEMFRKRKPHDMIAFSQALVYNANKQHPGRRGDNLQQEIGWDTLNWASPATDGKAHEWPHPRNYGQYEPQVRLNWQAKLVPVTRLRQAQLLLPGDFSRLLRDVDPSSPRAKLH